MCPFSFPSLPLHHAVWWSSLSDVARHKIIVAPTSKHSMMTKLVERDSRPGQSRLYRASGCRLIDQRPRRSHRRAREVRRRTMREARRWCLTCEMSNSGGARPILSLQDSSQGSNRRRPNISAHAQSGSVTPHNHSTLMCKIDPQQRGLTAMNMVGNR